MYVCDIVFPHFAGVNSIFSVCFNRFILTGKSCGSAGEIINGQFVYTGIEFGDTATAVCDEG